MPFQSIGCQNKQLCSNKLLIQLSWETWARKRQPHCPSKDHKEREKPLQLVFLTSISFSCAFFRRVVPRAASSLSLLFMSLLCASAVLWQECWYTLVCWREEEGKEEGKGGEGEKKMLLAAQCYPTWAHS